MSVTDRVRVEQPAVPRRPTRFTPGDLSRHPVAVATAFAALLHVLWWWLLASSGGDIAAQDAWAEFARAHPGSAYNLAWYGGMHPVNYSILAPYVMGALGVRTTMMLAGTVSAGLLALVLTRSKALDKPLWPALYGALALAGNAVSGRVTFGLGMMFALAAVSVIYGWPTHWRSPERRHRWPRAILAAVFSAAATASSPVAGLFLGVIAAALWLQRRRNAAYAVGLPPVVVVALSAWLFPFSGHQPMPLASVILPVVTAVAVVVLAPRTWRSIRVGAVLYVAGVLAAWVIPSQVGTNVTRLGLLFGGVVLVAIAARAASAGPLGHGWGPVGNRRAVVALVLAIVTASIWQVATAARDVVGGRPDAAWSVDLRPLVHQLQARGANEARVEVVPAKSHREASALAPYVNLARGWNRQADAERNPIFYDDELLTPASYRAWLDRWAVSYVVLSKSTPDAAARAENDLVAGGLGYLHAVWSDTNWTLFEVEAPRPLADAPAVVTSFDATELVLNMPTPGRVLVRIPASPWLSLLDAEGDPIPPPSSDPDSPDAAPVNVEGCLSHEVQPVTVEGQTPDDWTVLYAPHAGTYRIAAPYQLHRGTACPDEITGEGGTDSDQG
ncbi:MFS family permease [Nocardioides ginsengisegetis]|uniref:MFS family permease n=1 Tax=Nocardioides ginsengisegetis TaxID=661491 RepID=A0A7W3IXM2_9ACTN|nr:MFS transporter [Nocardioides ginsengisegetis]MBA8802551.1 MFS family permease [Nocardioides ginsengisegetis]